MKKSLVIAGLAASILLTSSIANAATTTNTDNNKQPAAEKQMPQKGDKKFNKEKRPSIDERLNLTEEQKQKAHEIRMKGHEQIKPVFEKIKAKKEEIKEIAQNTKLSDEQKTKKINALEIDILKHKQEARKIRMQNTKEFESILTAEQKTEFNKMKEEGRKMHMMKKHHGPKGPKGQPGQDKRAPQQ